MNNVVSCIIGVVSGAAVGSFVTYIILKKNFDKVLSEERAEIKQAFVDINKKQNEHKEEKTEKQEEPEEKEEKKDGPYVITPEEFGEMDKYKRITLYYYADDILTDMDDNRIIEIEELIGDEALDKFGEYEDDCVYVRDDKLLRDYEILLDERNYKDL